MKVLHTYRTYFPDPPGGLQEAIRQICISAKAYNITNNVFCLSPDPKPKQIAREESTVYREKSWWAPASCDIGLTGSIAKFSSLSKEADIAHYHFPWPFADVLHFASMKKKPSIMTYHSDIVRQVGLNKLYQPLMWRMLRSMDIIISTSPAYAETSEVLRHRDIRDKIRIVPLGINEETYTTRADTSIYKKLSLIDDEPFFLFIGVTRYYKGLEYLINAAKGLECKIVIAGSGPELSGFKEYIAQNDINNIVFAGQVSEEEKIALLQKCYSLVLPSHLRSEAFGMVLVEAQIFAKPLISCEIGTGTSYVNQHLESGLVIPPANSSELHNAMNELLKNSQLAQTLSKGSRLRFEKNFSGTQLGQAYHTLYQEICR